jgi:hypothetical protein
MARQAVAMAAHALEAAATKPDEAFGRRRFIEILLSLADPIAGSEFDAPDLPPTRV